MYLAPQNIPSAIVLKLDDKVILYLVFSVCLVKLTEKNLKEGGEVCSSVFD